MGAETSPTACGVPDSLDSNKTPQRMKIRQQPKALRQADERAEKCRVRRGAPPIGHEILNVREVPGVGHFNAPKSQLSSSAGWYNLMSFASWVSISSLVDGLACGPWQCAISYIFCVSSTASYLSCAYWQGHKLGKGWPHPVPGTLDECRWV